MKAWTWHESIEYRLKKYSVPEPNTGCWLWNGSNRGPKNHKYGTLFINKKAISVHRLSYENFIGPIPEGKDILHKCDTSLCINPNHLWAGTHQENMKDMSKKGRSKTAPNSGRFKKQTHCKKGLHELSGKNIRLIKTGKLCRPCANAAQNLRRKNVRYPLKSITHSN